MVIFNFMKELSVHHDEPFRIDNIIFGFARSSLGGIALGLVAGLVLCFWLSFVYNDRLLIISCTFFAAYIVFYVAEETALSGILAIVALGLYMSGVGKTRISNLDEEACHNF